MTARHWKWVIAGLFVAAVAGLWILAPVDEWIRNFNAWLAEVGPLGWIVYGVVYIVACVALLPGSALTLAAGLAFGLAAFPLVVVSATLGAWAAFLVGRYLARDAVSKRFADSERFRAVDEAVAQEGWKIVGLMRLSPLVPFNLQNYLFGLTDVKFWHYAWATFFGIMPGTLLYVYFGAAGRAALNEAAGAADSSSPLRWVFLVVGLIATLAVTVIVTRAAKQRLAAIAAVDEGAAS
ncbi:MAG: TVP38/TMEM64 family protein [Pseudomonadota bacterium]